MKFLFLVFQALIAFQTTTTLHAFSIAFSVSSSSSAAAAVSTMTSSTSSSSSSSTPSFSSAPFNPAVTSASASASASLDSPSSSPPPPPVVYTIAGSDSGGGAGIQADLHVMHAMGVHGCSAITCLTAQNSMGVTQVHVPPMTFLQEQLQTLQKDMPPRAIKIGMLGTQQIAETVGNFLQTITSYHHNNSHDNNHDNNHDDTLTYKQKPWIVVDPVMISTSGHLLIDEACMEAMKTNVFPYADVLTPNKYEAEALLGRTLHTPADVEQGARQLLQLTNAKSILIKGGHSLMEKHAQSTTTTTTTSHNDEDTNHKNDTHHNHHHDDDDSGYAQDYFATSLDMPDEPRLCDGGVWLRTKRYDTEHTHGTGCTLSSAMASALAWSHLQQEQQANEDNNNNNNSSSSSSSSTAVCQGATLAIGPLDAACLAKAYVTAGIHTSVGIGQGPGPVAHTTFPSNHEYYPRIVVNMSTTTTATNRTTAKPPFPRMKAYSSIQNDKDNNDDNNDTDIPTLGRILPIVDTVEWVERLVSTPGITDIQLRIKDETDPTKILERVQHCQDLCTKAAADGNTASGIRLWINDYWEAAVQAKCFGVHVGQEDLYRLCQTKNGLESLSGAGIALGISTHSYGELAAALSMDPTYISLGPIFGTTSKTVAFKPQGLDILKKWRQLIPPHIPFVTIGGINHATSAHQTKMAGSDCAAVIGAITTHAEKNIPQAVKDLNHAMS